MLSLPCRKTPGNENASPWRGAAVLALRRASLSAACRPLHAPLARRCEAEARVQTVHVLRMQDPAQVGLRPVLDGLAHELHTEPAPAIVGQDIDVEQPRVGHVVGGDAAEPDLPALVVQADDARGVADQML